MIENNVIERQTNPSVAKDWVLIVGRRLPELAFFVVGTKRTNVGVNGRESGD